MDWKKIGLIFGFTALVILLGFLIFKIFFGSSPAQPPVATIPPQDQPTNLPLSNNAPEGQKSAQQNNTGLPLAGQPTLSGQPEDIQPQIEITPLETSDNQSLHIGGDGTSVVTFDALDGKFYRISPSGKTETLTDQTFKGANAITFSPKADKAVISFIDNSKIVYDFEQKKQVTIPKHWEQFDFSPEGDKIAFKSTADSPENRWLAVANADGSGGKLLEPLGKKGEFFDVNWSPSNQIVGTFREGIDSERERLYFIGLNGENFKSTVIEGRGIETMWTPKGERLMYSSFSAKSGYRPELWIVDALGDTIGQNRQRLNIQTWAHKCTFATPESLYCAVPASLNEGAGLLPATVDSPDILYKIDMQTGGKTKIAELPAKYTVDSLIVPQDQSAIFFRDKYTNNLYKVTTQ